MILRWHSTASIELKKGVAKESLVLIDFNQTINLGNFTIKTYHGRHAVLPKTTPSKFAEILGNGNLKNLPYITKENKICIENDETVFYEIEAEGKRIAIMRSLNLRGDVNYPANPDVLILPYNG